MPSILSCLPVTGDLAPTATHKRRWWSLVLCTDPADLRDATLTISQTKGARPGCKVETDTYAVQETPCIGRIGRSFLLLDLTDADQPDVYECYVGTRPQDWSCTCKAGSCGTRCKHADALADIIGRGELPDPSANPEADCGADPAEAVESAPTPEPEPQPEPVPAGPITVYAEWYGSVERRFTATPYRREDGVEVVAFNGLEYPLRRWRDGRQGSIAI